MKLSIIYVVHNQFALAQTAIQTTINNLSTVGAVEIIVLDNASNKLFPKMEGVNVVRLENNIGVYPTFWEGLKHTSGDIVAYFHSDLIITEYNWDTRIMRAFEIDDKLGLVGFVGSNEIDSCGGRGLGTCSNFQGIIYTESDGLNHYEWTGSPAEAHGRRIATLEPACVVDGCAMIFRREVLEKIPQRKDFPPHHFYDRLLSCETREIGYTMATMGIACDHISGQTVNQESSYGDMARSWLETNHVPYERGQEDNAIYLEAERQWLKEYRDIKKLVPCKTYDPIN